ncbi:hypothetical protein Asi02nite_48020 [Asanoa siamensis]|uniref:Uncharacterized protein n=1 Tax=Asanoa siamensis TaxID=926357 RepID=A0ABQ4CVG6_9ACTN|nr:hypothetical protein Asi02nite_48020 [Asanoa siamensis]
MLRLAVRVASSVIRFRFAVRAARELTRAAGSVAADAAGIALRLAHRARRQLGAGGAAGADETSRRGAAMQGSGDAGERPARRLTSGVDARSFDAGRLRTGTAR